MRIVTSLFIMFGLAACSRTAEQPPAEAPAEAPAAAEAPTPSTAPAVTATATLSPTQGNKAAGMLTLTVVADGVHVTGMVEGLKPDSEFGFHVHEKGDCSAPDASSAGSHFNPAGASHGGPSSPSHHLGDMLNLTSDHQGMAKPDIHVVGATLGSGGNDDVLGKAVVVHAMPDDYQSQPSGNSGSRIACGVIAADAGAPDAAAGAPPAAT